MKQRQGAHEVPELAAEARREVEVLNGVSFVGVPQPPTGGDTMELTLTLAAGLLAAPEPQAEPRKGRVVEVRGFTEHRQRAEPPKGEGWIIEVRGFTGIGRQRHR